MTTRKNNQTKSNHIYTEAHRSRSPITKCISFVVPLSYKSLYGKNLWKILWEWSSLRWNKLLITFDKNTRKNFLLIALIFSPILLLCVHQVSVDSKTWLRHSHVGFDLFIRYTNIQSDPIDSNGINTNDTVLWDYGWCNLFFAVFRLCFSPSTANSKYTRNSDITMLSPITATKAVETLIEFVDPLLGCIITNLTICIHI